MLGGFKRGGKEAFTLIELLVVIAILGVLGTAVVLVLNPSELIKQGRDSTRLSDLAALNSALALFQTDRYMNSMGQASTTYVSIPDSTSTCANLGLPTLPSGSQYHCASTSTYAKTDGTGWVPVNFNLISSGSPLSKLPVDPINNTSSGLYYTYTPGGSWDLASSMESQKYKLGGQADAVSKDGGFYPDLYEVGSNLSLLPFDYGDTGLVGYWPMNEKSGLTTYDKSGRGGTGTVDGATWSSTGLMGLGHNVTARVLLPAPVLNAATTWSVCTKFSGYVVGTSFDFYIGGSGSGSLLLNQSSYAAFRAYDGSYKAWDGTGNASAVLSSSLAGRSVHLCWTSNGSVVNLYVDGISKGYINPPDTRLYVNKLIEGYSSNYWTPTINLDDVRIYNRVLSGAEVQALYSHL